MVTKKKIEINGEEPKTLEEHIKNISDPTLKQHLEQVNSRFKELKNEVEQVNQSTDQFGEFFNKFKKSFSPHRDSQTFKNRSRAANYLPQNESSFKQKS